MPGALRIGLVEIVFVFLFVDLFDNVGTLVAVGKKAGLFDRAHQIPRVNRILFADATATVVGSLAGTSTVVSYIESAAGVVAGGRTGVTAIVVGLLFAATMFVAPWAPFPGGRHRARPDHRRRHDDGAAARSSGRPGGVDPGLPDHDHHPADLQHRQRPGLRLYGLHAAQGRQLSGEPRRWLLFALAALFVARFVDMAVEG